MLPKYTHTHTHTHSPPSLSLSLSLSTSLSPSLSPYIYIFLNYKSVHRRTETEDRNWGRVCYSAIIFKASKNKTWSMNEPENVSL